MSRAWTDRIAEEVGPFDVWQAESVITLGQAVALRDRFGGRVVYDANESTARPVGWLVSGPVEAAPPAP